MPNDLKNHPASQRQYSNIVSGREESHPPPLLSRAGEALIEAVNRNRDWRSTEIQGWNGVGSLVDVGEVSKQIIKT
jgi:hypothetical protein